MNCKYCHKEKTANEFVKNGSYKKLAKVCKDCWLLRIKQQSCFKTKTTPVPRRRRFSSGLISYFKMRPCMDCNIEYPPWIMQYDHRPEEKKKFGISGSNKISGVSSLKILEEIKKCDVVCANCHMHRTLIRQIGNEAILTYGDYIKELPFYGKTITETEELFKAPPSEQTLNFRKERESIGKGKPRPNSRKVERPSKEKLEKLVWKTPTWKLAEEFGVSDQAISKWCKCYGISKPPRGYWAKLNSKKNVSE